MLFVLLNVMQGSMELFVRVEDVDIPGDAASLVAIFVIPVNTTQMGISSMIYRDTRYQGSFLRLSFNMSCSQNFYGEDCTASCIQKDDASGHYICDSHGKIECMAGFQNPLTNCTECSLAPGCCKCVLFKCDNKGKWHVS